MPDSLERLIQQLTEAVSDLTARLERAEITVEQWQREMEKLLTRYHEAAFMVGQDSDEIDDAALAIIMAAIDSQLEYLAAFAATIAEVMTAGAGIAAWMAAWNSRAAMYAQAAKTSYWRGYIIKIGLPPLPYVPGDGSSECLTNCHCWLQIETLSEQKGNYDIYWRLGAEKHCPTCPRRERSWNPLKVRGGKIV